MVLPQITVIIPVYNDGFRLNKCLEAISKQEYDLALIEVRVIDNNSQSDIASIVAQYPFAKYLRENIPGSYAARNKGLIGTVTELIAFTDSDCIPTTTWLSSAVASIQTNKVDAVGGKVELFSNNKQPNIYECYDLIMGFHQQRYIEKEKFSVTANLIVKTNVLEKTGVFNSKLMSSGDKDWCRRMVSKGHTLIYCDSSVVLHPTRNTLKSITTKLRRVLGGCYYQHKNLKSDKLFTIESILRGFLPPLTSIKKINASSLKLSFSKYLGLIGLFYFIQLYSVFYRMKLKFIKGSAPERL